MPQSKTEIAAYVSQVKEQILGGYIDGCETAIMLKSLEDTIKALRGDEDIKRFIMQEAEKYGKSFEFKGAKFSISGRKTFDFVDDSEWFILNTQIEELKAKQKERETFLKAVTKPVADPETGEIINPVPYTQLDIISITLSK